MASGRRSESVAFRGADASYDQTRPNNMQLASNGRCSTAAENGNAARLLRYNLRSFMQHDATGRIGESLCSAHDASERTRRGLRTGEAINVLSRILVCRSGKVLRWFLTNELFPMGPERSRRSTASTAPPWAQPRLPRLPGRHMRRTGARPVPPYTPTPATPGRGLIDEHDIARRVPGSWDRTSSNKHASRRAEPTTSY